MHLTGLSAFVGAIAVGDLVKTTLGPKGMDKILQSAYAPPTRSPGYMEQSNPSIADSPMLFQLNRRDHGYERRCYDLEVHRPR